PLFQRRLARLRNGGAPPAPGLLSSSDGHGRRPAPETSHMTQRSLLNFDGTPFPFRSMDEVTALLTGPGAPYETGEVVVRGERLRDWVAGPANLREVFAA